MNVSFCLEVLEKVIDKYEVPETIDTDQGSQFTWKDLTEALLTREIRISIDGRGHWTDNVFIERLWWSVKYEEVYLKE